MDFSENNNNNETKTQGNLCNVPNCSETMNYLPFRCKYCGGTFCKKHRLPENHNCEFSMPHKSPNESISIETPTNHQEELSTVNDTSDYLYDPENEIPDIYNTESDNSSKYETELDEEMRRYVRQQEREIRKQERQSSRRSNSINRRSRNVSGVRVEHRNPFITQSNKPLATYWMMGIFTGMFLLYWLLSLVNVLNFRFFLLRLDTLRAGFFLPLVLSMVTPEFFFSLLFILIMLFGTGRRLEMRYGPKFILSLFFSGAIIGTLTIILIQSIGLFITGFEFLLTPTSTLWCGMMAIFSFIIYLIGLDREMRFILYFIPVQMKGRTMLYILMGINLATALFGIILKLLVPDGPYGSAVASSLGQFAAIFVGKFFYDKFGHQIPLRFF